MGRKYLVDSNVLIDYASGRLPLIMSNFVEQLFEQQFFISVIVMIEVLGFEDSPPQMGAMEDFVGLAQVIPLDEPITMRTVDLRRKYKKLKLADAIIAATALEYNLVLITRNVGDFKNIQELLLLNPYSIC
jgi:predicted nucleic acid-binding protein